MTKEKKSSEISADENQEIFREIVNIFLKVRKIFENREENLKQGGNASWSHGGWTPVGSVNMHGQSRGETKYT